MGAGFVLYKGGLFGAGSQPALTQNSPAAALQSQQVILPYGDTLNFSQVIDPQRFLYGVVVYPKLDPQNEVGVPENNLIVPLPAK